MELILYGKPDCLLCDRLEAMLSPHLHTLGAAASLTKRNIEDNHDWYETFWSRIPVLTLGDEVLLEGRPSQTQVDEVFVSLLDDLST